MGLSVNGHYVDTELRLGFNEAQEEETATENGTHSLEQSNAFESVLGGASGELQVANQMCEELRTKLIAAENQLVAMQSRNAANEQSVITLQERLDKLLESQEKADEQIPEAEVYEPENPEVVLSFHKSDHKNRLVMLLLVSCKPSRHLIAFNI